MQLGDIIVTATDGLFDNMPDHMILQELKELKVGGAAELLRPQDRPSPLTTLVRPSEEQLRQHPEGGAQPGPAGPRPGPEPHLHVALRPVRLRQRPPRQR